MDSREQSRNSVKLALIHAGLALLVLAGFVLAQMARVQKDQPASAAAAVAEAPGNASP